ncbi:Ig-like domain-containing protein [Candidatus Accumulibacter phosphatis]|uniref:Ig-like domain-containing protein n=1 Tax=Candidatus Accumulibacter phosphatis TaxID=327160 RepID=UPI0039B8C1C7
MSVRLLDPATSTTADGTGTFRLADLPLALGDNAFQVVLADAAGNETKGLLVITRLALPTDTTAPTLSAALLADTGASASDGLTFDARFAGSASDDVGVVQLLAQLDPATPDAPFADLTTLLATDGAFTLSRSTLDALADGTLADGAHTLRFVAVDAAGNRSEVVERHFTLDSHVATPTLQLAFDTGSDDHDRITLTGTLNVAGSEAGATVEYSIDAGASWAPSFTAVEGDNHVAVRQTDLAGNVSLLATLAFVLDTLAPTLTHLDLAPESDSGTLGDRETSATLAIVVGRSEAGASVRLLGSDRQTTANGDGVFTFADLPLALGDNHFDFVASDTAGNETAARVTIVRVPPPITDTSAPTLSAALVADTGTSASDGLTFDARFTGSASDDIGVVQLLAQLDPATADAPFADLTTLLATDGTFALSRSRLDTLAGGTLADGAHTLRFVAVDAAGNRSNALERHFTLDTAAPTFTGFGLSVSDATNAALDETTAGSVLLKGSAEAGAAIRFAAQDIEVVAGAGGAFVMPGVALALGANELTLTASDAAGNTTTFDRTLTRTVAVQADAVLEWNDLALRAVQLDVTDPPVATRTLAMVSLAQYDALAATEGTPAYLVGRSVSGPVSAPAAVAVAAHRVLSQTYPAQQAVFDSALAADLAAIADGEAKDRGIALGLAIADAVLALRTHDGSQDFAAYDGSTALGQWRPTGPMFDVADDPQWGTVQPFALRSPDQFRPAAPPALDTAAYAASVEEVKRLGSATSSERTADQTVQALFWADGKGSYTPPGHWNQIAEEVARAKGNSLAANARLFAQLNVALADAAIACWDAKYAYGLWRPETAIQNADLDDNAATTVDSAWRPLLLTPPHPEYVSGHSTFSTAAAGILAATFGDATAFSTTSATLPGVTRSFTSFTQAAQEAGRSRIYGGIHYEFTNQAGQQLGTQVAEAVLARFALTSDTQAPAIVLDDTPAATNANLTLTGQVLDNLSGVASAQFQIDDGALQALVLDASGGFTVTTALATDGSADGAHTITIVARDAAGNANAGVTRGFTLDTLAPTLTLDSLADGDTLSAASRLAGTANATGSALTQLSYRIDGGTSRSLIFDASGAFDEALTYGDLDVGSHALVLTARDAAGNLATLTRTLVVDALAPLTVTSLTPTDGSDDVGVTVRPQVRFSRAVDAATLTAESFFATGPDGSTLAATIVPANDGTFAWLFFTTPMPGASQVTLHVDGSKIRGAADGSFLDADGDGTAGGTLTQRFTTVSRSAVIGTTLVGKVVDPGPDLEPMSFDDIRRGADGVIHTPDDVFLLPIAHAKVYLLGLEERVVYTDENGNFELTDVPAGTVKVAVDGRTSTNAPTGVFFPEMVMDVELIPGVTNTVMGGMGATAERLANVDRREVYLPRVPTNALQRVSDTETTVITLTDAASAPQLSEQERAALTLTVHPGSAIGEDGHVLDDVQIGISTVPPELVRDMLPPGVLQHTFDITIQAPGVAAFAEPVQITSPNVFHAAPGTKLNLLSFDHTTGMLVINGTGTVSADGLTVVSDPDSGIRAPGWHGWTPPTNCGGSGGSAPQPPTPSTPADTQNERESVAEAMITGETGSLSTITWTAPDKLPSTPPTPAPPPGCPAPAAPPNPPGMKQPYIKVTIDVDGPLATFMKQTGNLPLTSQSFNLAAGSGEIKTFGGVAKSYAELLGASGLAGLDRDRLYGSSISITEETGNPDGSKHTEKYRIYLYRWVDVVDADEATKKSGNTAAFFRTNVDGVVRKKDVDFYLPSAVVTTFSNGGPAAGFDLSGSYSNTISRTWTFDPSIAGKNQTSTFDIRVNDFSVPGGLLNVGELVAKGTATEPTTVSLNLSGFEAQLRTLLTNIKELPPPSSDFYSTVVNSSGITLNFALSAPFASAFSEFLPGHSDYGDVTSINARVKQEANNLLAEVSNDFAALGRGMSILADDLSADVQTLWKIPDMSSQGELGSAIWDVDKDWLEPILRSHQIGDAAQQWALAEALNQMPDNKTGGSLAFGAIYAVPITMRGWMGPATFAQNVAESVSHEIAHTFGLPDAYNSTGKPVDPPNDIMRAYRGDNPDLSFSSQNLDIMRAALGLQQDGSLPLTAALSMFRKNFYLPSDESGIPINIDLNAPAPAIGLRLETDDIVAGQTVQVNSPSTDGSGGESAVVELVLSNAGNDYLEIHEMGLESTSSGFSAWFSDGGGPGPRTLPTGGNLLITVAFDPTKTGPASDTLVVRSNASINPEFRIELKGRGLSPAPMAKLTLTGSNNLGGLRMGDPAKQRTAIATLSNEGANPLLITAARLADGSNGFSLVGVPGDLATTPLSLAHGQSVTIGASFEANQLGLVRDFIEFTTNDPTQPVIRMSLVGTGLAALPYPKWSENYFAVQTPDIAAAPPLRVRSDTAGNFTVALPPLANYHLVAFDPVTGLVAHGYGQTGAGGGGTNLVANLVFDASTANDSDFDGLPDDVEFAIGSNAAKSDTDRDGLTDFAEMAQGLDPLDGRGSPARTLAVVPLAGEAKSVALVGNPATGGQTAFVATGSGGLAIVDASRVREPNVLGQIDLAGDAVDVSVDVSLARVAVASTSALQIVDVSNPAAPRLTYSLATPALDVEVANGVAHVAAGTGIESFDLLTGEHLQTLALGGQPTVGLAVDGTTLYAVDDQHTLHAIDLTGTYLSVLGSVRLPDSNGKLFVGNRVAYLAAGSGIDGGFLTVDVSNPAAMTLLSGVDRTDVAGEAIVANGSGLALTVGKVSAPSGPLDVLDVLDVRDSRLTDQLRAHLTLGAAPASVAIGSGIAFVAQGAAGLAVINYLAADTGNVAPTVIASAEAADLDWTHPGIQVQEGSTIRIDLTVDDDTQVRSVELLLDGRVIASDVSFPWDRAVTLPAIGTGDGTATLQVRATDTGGNVGLSDLMPLHLSRDNTSPTLASSSLADGSRKGVGLRIVNLAFSEPLDAVTINPASVQLFDGVGHAIAPQSIQFGPLESDVRIIYEPLAAGDYRFVLDETAVTDRAGNRLGDALRESRFTVSDERTVEWVAATGGLWSDPANWSTGTLPGAGDDVVVALPTFAVVTFDSGDTSIRSLHSSAGLAITGGSLSLAEASVVNGPFSMSGGTLGGRGTLTLEGKDNTWSGGMMTGGGTTRIAADGEMHLRGGENKAGLNDRTLINEGVLTFDEGYVSLTDSVLIRNLGTFLITGNVGFYNLYDDAYPVVGSSIDNSGLIRIGSVDSPGGLESLLDLNNVGTVEIGSGSYCEVYQGAISVDVGGTITLARDANLDCSRMWVSGEAEITVAPGAYVYVSLGSVTGMASITGGGDVRFDEGPFAIATSGEMDVNLNAYEGTLVVEGTVTISRLALHDSKLTGAGELIVTGSTILDYADLRGGGRLRIAPSATALVSASLALGDWTIDNAGTLLLGHEIPRVYDVAVAVDALAVINNTGTLLIDPYWGGSIRDSGTGRGSLALNNSGSIVVSTGGSDFRFENTSFNNSGDVRVETGTVVVSGGRGTSSGTFSAASGSTFEFAGGEQDFTGSGHASGDGILKLSGGLLSMAPGTNDIRLVLTGGELTLDGPVTARFLDMTGGSVTGTGPLTLTEPGSELLGGTISVPIIEPPDTVAPSIVASDLADGSILSLPNGVGLTGTGPIPPVVIFFSESMKPSTLNAANLHLLTSSGLEIDPVDIAIGDHFKSVTLSFPHLGLGTYQLILLADKIEEHRAGKNLGGGATTLATFQVIRETQPPSILRSNLPYDGTPAVVRESFRELTLEFTEPIDPDALRASGITLSDGTNLYTPEVLSMTADGAGVSAVTLSLPSLKSGAYTVILDNIVDLSGNKFDSATLSGYEKGWLTFRIVGAKWLGVPTSTWGLWSDPTGWQDGHLPEPTDAVFVPTFESMSLVGNASAKSLELGTDAHLSISSGTLTVSEAFTMSRNSLYESIVLGEGGAIAGTPDRPATTMAGFGGYYWPWIEVTASALSPASLSWIHVADVGVYLAPGSVLHLDGNVWWDVSRDIIAGADASIVVLGTCTCVFEGSGSGGTLNRGSIDVYGHLAVTLPLLNDGIIRVHSSLGATLDDSSSFIRGNPPIFV